MTKKNLAGFAIIALFAFQSCKKEGTVDSATSMKDSTTMNEISTETLATGPSETKSADSSNANEMFSAVKNKKVNLDKDAITLTSVKEGNSDKAYLIFNDDQSKVEVFMPKEKKGIMYDRKGTEGNYTWTDGKNELIQWKGYVLRTLKQAIPLFNGDSM